ncbi:hypothetical protein RSF51_000153 [Yersinia enterocolitica]|nr:hypothetical protein [Yersinia enterocolitica]NGN37098.1 nucleoside permease [Yersinia enterocolitica subsp. palearctica]EKN3494622.1 hypothetical protein [Yersinia enterocolitica]EKN3507100.1 hypothetical protein [Yersinia enterocolitica]EKN3555801.1 hypothetical protein [Yersinia enterocolitica]
MPFFLSLFGIKRVIMISMVAWTLRFALFAYGDPSGKRYCSVATINGCLWLCL